MKRIILLCGIAVLFASCQKEEPQLSCNPEINEWAKETVCSIDQYDRQTIISLPYMRQRAVYRGLTASAKYTLWQEKFNLIRNDNTLSVHEIKKLEELYKHLSPAVYKDDNLREEFKIFAIKWKDTMQSQYGWDDEKVFIYTCTWMSSEEFQQSILLDRIAEEMTTKDGITPGDLQKKDCNCYYSVYCALHGLGNICDSSNIPCNIVPDCGIMGTSSCTGRCA